MGQYAGSIASPFFRRGHWMVFAIYGILLFLFTRTYSGYRIGILRIAELVYSQGLALLMVNAITYLQICLLSLRFVNPAPIFFLYLCQLCFVVLWSYLCNRWFYDLFPPHQLLMVYDGSTAESLVYKMSTRSEKYDICEAINIREGIEAVYERIGNYRAVIICDVKSGYRNEILKHCYRHSIRVYLTPKISDTIIRGADSIHLFDTPLLLCRNQGLSLEQRFFKRTVDILVSGIGIVLSSPFMLLTAAAIKLYDRGPVIFKQDRLTTGGKVFQIYKFRSMVADAEKESGARLAAANDHRVTRVGKVIRAIRFDELPQLWNILIGDMSLVGPRPERPEIARRYEEQMSEFEFRLKVKAGLTGYAQVLGKYNTTPYDKLKLDLMYIENYSGLLDLKILFMTVKVLFMKESTEGIIGPDFAEYEDPSKDVHSV